MKLALMAMLPLILLTPAETSAQRSRTAKPAPTTATVTVTDLSGAPLADVRVNLIGGLDRSGSTQLDGTVKFDGLRPGSYRLRFTKDGYIVFEREIEVRAGQPAPAPSVALTPSPESAAASTPSEPETPSVPPPGQAVTLNLPDFIERNFITSSQPQKVSDVSCSGVAQTVLWQVREPWDNRQHETADTLLYVVGGEGTLRLDGRETPLEAGVFAQVPRGTTYSLTRRGRNPVIVLATLVGDACQ